jgi:hypothetical protein
MVSSLGKVIADLMRELFAEMTQLKSLLVAAYKGRSRQASVLRDFGKHVDWQCPILR